MPIDEKALAEVREKWGTRAPVKIIIEAYEAAKNADHLAYFNQNSENTENFKNDQARIKKAEKCTDQPVELPKRGYSDIAEEHLYAKSNLEDKLLEFGLTDWDKLWTDPYDNSIELDSADNENRLSPEAQKYLAEQGFSICWLTHKDGMETYYNKLEGEEGSRKKSHRTPKRESIEVPFRRADHVEAMSEIIGLCKRTMKLETTIGKPWTALDKINRIAARQLLLMKTPMQDE